mmetsp:Transcript_15839/g.30617  ORF Transcript_15839/g.30617 Transcript_15839/m.30617 type:complete len:717 (-) Transcript_15839:127-2277(-)|eukprot:CAMPEP_0171569102 /NCGR_PEP_ID=MMETSP0961-20121227/2152_1 /TAXON_ID=87120 /ORGANISM="Aurantiochytrium limacinum, Strain ATCCMYA-1381" /LENGTH=716 /DNA_ID=CAMNT_0012123343 /DNA_START=311 /DNA_END=2461 /DNA_ORIENTATION=-
MDSAQNFTASATIGVINEDFDASSIERTMMTSDDEMNVANLGVDSTTLDSDVSVITSTHHPTSQAAVTAKQNVEGSGAHAVQTRSDQRRPLGGESNDGHTRFHEDPAFFESIVRRTNDLFVKLNITTRPIQAFEELQKSASSMFVAIFETLFNVRLKNVIRKPRVVTDYITNAELVMAALSESLPIDLSFLSGEDIYRGDPMQIHHMLSIFESLWNQLYEAPSIAAATAMAGGTHAQHGGDIDASTVKGNNIPFTGVTSNSPRSTTGSSGGSLEGAIGGRFPSSPRHMSPSSRGNARSHTPFPGHISMQSIDLSDVGDDTRKSSPQPQAPHTVTGSGRPANVRPEKGKARKPKRATTVSKKKLSTLSKSDLVTKGAKPSEVTKTVSSTVARKPRVPQRAAKARYLDEEDNRKVQSKIRARKRQEGHLPATKGVSRLHDAAEKMQQTFSEPNSFAQVRSEADVEGLKVLAECYPSIYRSVWAQQKAAAAKKTRRPQHAHKKNNVTRRLEDDLSRYRKAYQILIKTHEAEIRKSTIRAKRAATMASRAEKLDSRVERARSRRYQESFENLEQSHSLRRQTKEEVLVRTLFSKALKIEKEYLLAVKEQEADEQAKLDKERLDRYESIERYYLDQEEMLKERVDKENREKNISEQARRIALKQLESRLRSEYQTRLERMTEEWSHNEDHALFRSEEQLSQAFEEINDQLVTGVRLATAMR